MRHPLSPGLRLAGTLLAGLAAVTALPALAAPGEVEPGRWEATTQITDIEAPGMPAQMVQMMKGRPMSVRYCVTPEDAARGPEKMLEESQKNNGECRMVKHSISGNRMVAEMQCQSKEMGASRIQMEGEFNPVAYNLKANMESSGGPFRRMSSTMSAKRIGAC